MCKGPQAAVQADDGAEDDSEEDEAPRKSATKAAKRGSGQKRPAKAAKRSRNIFIDDAAEEDDDVSGRVGLSQSSALASANRARGACDQSNALAGGGCWGQAAG
jgi:hypothetical protein